MVVAFGQSSAITEAWRSEEKEGKNKIISNKKLVKISKKFKNFVYISVVHQPCYVEWPMSILAISDQSRSDIGKTVKMFKAKLAQLKCFTLN